MFTADVESFPTEDDITYLYEITHDWLVDHGEGTPSNGRIGTGLDGFDIAHDPKIYAANLPVAALRERVPEALAALGVRTTLHIAVFEPYYDIGDSSDELTPESALFTHDHAADSPLTETSYWLVMPEGPNGTPVADIDQEARKLPTTEPLPATPEEWALRREERIEALLEAKRFVRETGAGRMTLSVFEALKTVMEVWTEQWRELSSAEPSRRLDW